MSLPWDAENIAPNLQTLSRLRRGDHLSVLKDGENTDGETYSLNGRGLRSHFKIEGKMRQSFVRTKKGETILEDDQYLSPLTRFFRAAVDAWGRHQVSGDLVMGGCRGLENLQHTYANDQTRRAKITQILDAVRRELRGIRVEGIFVSPGDRRLILGDQNFPGMRRRILDIITEARDNAGLRNEYANGITQEFVDGVFGKNAVPQKATLIPVGDMTYVRELSGFCAQFHRDAHVGSSVRLRGERLSCSEEDIAKLYRFANRDEGMMFAISQLSSQAGVSGLHTMILEMGGRDGQNPVPLIQVGADRLCFQYGPGGCNITKSGNMVIISSGFEWEGNAVVYTRNGIQMGDFKPLSEFGITSVVIRFAVALQRIGNRIDLQLHESKLRIVTT